MFSYYSMNVHACYVLNVCVLIFIPRSGLQHPPVSSTSFPRSSLSREKDPGWVWSRGTQILSGDKCVERKRLCFRQNKRTISIISFVTT